MIPASHLNSLGLSCATVRSRFSASANALADGGEVERVVMVGVLHDC